MCLACRLALALAFVSALGAAPSPLRVCADPNNMPFSNRAREGFENKIAQLVAHDLGRPLAYFWFPQRRGFVRNTISAGRCDLIVGVPAGFERVATTRPYYRSSYVFVTRRDRQLDVHSFDDERLRDMRIAIQVTGDDYANPPAAQALAVRHLVRNVRGFTVYGDYSRRDPQRDVIDAVADRSVDIAVVWGPLAGYFARLESAPMKLVPVEPSPDRDTPFRFAIAMGVRRDDRALHDAVDRVIAHRQLEIRRILSSFGVPLV